MRILVLPTAEGAGARAAARILDAVRANPRLVLGCATGGTMDPVYAHLRAAAGEVPFAGVTTFNLDEYVGLPPDHPQSYHAYMRAHFFDAAGMDPARCHLPRGDAPDPVAEAARYEGAIIAAGGIGLQFLGIGTNGHIGFNEPGTDHASRTGVRWLAARTRADNARYFQRPEDVPSAAISMGIGTIMDAAEILLVAVGAAKADAVRAMAQGPIDPACPASALRRHPRVTVVLDDAAAAGLRAGSLDARTGAG